MPEEEKFCVHCGAKIPADVEICPVCGIKQSSLDVRPKINIHGISVGFLIARLIASGMLLLALSRHPYGYYTLLRWMVCGTAAYGAFKSVELEKTGWVCVLGIIALLFNPIIPVHLSREIWAPIDVMAALIFVVSIFTIRRENYDDKTKYREENVVTKKSEEMMYSCNMESFLDAVEKGNKEAVKFFIDSGMVNAKDSNGWTALIKAAGNGYTDIAKLLINAGADVNAKSKMGWRALMGTAPDIVKLLINAGADVNVKTKYGWTALMYATRTESAKLLIDAGADVNAKDKNGVTALIKAAKFGYTDIAKLLIDAGADVNVRDKMSRHTALIWAATMNNTDIAKLLIDAGAAKGKDGFAALAYAASNGYTDIVKLLLDAAADVNAKDKYGDAALAYAASNGYTDIIKLLINAGADVNIRNYNGLTALMQASTYGHSEVVRILKEAGAKE